MKKYKNLKRIINIVLISLNVIVCIFILLMVIVFAQMFGACEGKFTFNEEKQVFENFYHLNISDECGHLNSVFRLEKKSKIKRVKSINLNEIPEGYYLTNSYGDTILPNNFKLKENCEYEIMNQACYDCATIIINVLTDENGKIHQKKETYE